MFVNAIKTRPVSHCLTAHDFVLKNAGEKNNFSGLIGPFKNLMVWKCDSE